MSFSIRTTLLAVSFLFCGCEGKLPEYHAPHQVHWLNQNWSPGSVGGFYHTPQGTEIIPYNWFLALEQPQLSINPFTKSLYLARSTT